MNTKHISLAFAAAAVAALLAGCAKSSVEEVNPAEQFTDLELSYVGATETKAAIDGNTFPQKGEIGLFLFKDQAATTPYGQSGYTNVKYSYNSNKSKWTADPSIKVGSTPGYLYGYYPYDSKTESINAIHVLSSLNGDDVMYAANQEAITDKTAANTTITMNHALARVSITVVNKGYTGNAKLSSIKFADAEIAESGTLNAVDGSITATKADTVTLSVPDTLQTIATGNGTTYECLLVPSAVKADRQNVTLTLTIDNFDKTANLIGNNGVIIAQGTKSNITINLSNTGISVKTVSVEDWNVVEVGGHKVTVKLSEDAGIENDVYLNATTDGSSVTIKALTTLTGRFTQCTCTPAGKATCSPSIDATTGICTFTITDVQDDITAEVSYLKYNATVAYDSNMGAVKLNGATVASEIPVQVLHGEEAKFIAEANTGYVFVKWTDGSDKDLSTDKPYTVSSVTSDITLKAIFGYEIAAKVTPVGAGTVTGAGIYAKGSTATLTAIAGGSGTEFVGWAKSDSPETIISTDNPYKFTVSQSASYVAVFKLKDALSGVFTVAADDQGNPKKKVQFSKGNLYCSGVEFNENGTVKSIANAQWGFEANQYDTTPSSNGNRDITHISHFMWCDNATDAMALKYESKCDGVNKTFFAAKNFTVNGYSGWCTLSKNEWQYLFNTRTMKNGKDRYTPNITYGGKMGLVLYPDDYSGSTLTSGTDYTDANFPAGCVFLPAAGYRDGGPGSPNPAIVSNVGIDGYYWSASPNDSHYAFDLYFNSGKVLLGTYDARNWAQSVRLVTESK